MCLETIPGDGDPWAARMGVRAAAGSCGAGDAREPPAKQTDATALPQTPQKQEDLVVPAGKAAALPASRVLFSSGSETEISREIRLPGVACGCVCSCGAVWAAVGLRALRRWGLEGMEGEWGKRQRSEGSSLSQRHRLWRGG